jgi:hypothetical protein
MGKSNIRSPVVAGQFYVGSGQGLNKQIEALVDKQAKKQDVIACMLPHAGYMYSGRVAAQTISRVNLKDKIILLGPNHTGLGAPFSIMIHGAWETPLGVVPINESLAQEILSHSQYLKEDMLAHVDEHSLEVELPFLQYFRSDFSIVPIAFLSSDVFILKEIGKEIASAIKDNKSESSTLIVASSDMTHYEPEAQAKKKDFEAIQAILELDEDKLMEKIQKLNISMCGYAPVIVMLSLAKSLGAKAAELVKYQTSGDVTQDKGSVVGYAGVIIF